MTNRFMRRVVVFALVVGLAAGRARAAELTPAQKQDMKSLYERATRAYDVGKYNEAIEEYQKAYEIGGDPPMLYNIAQAYRLNDQPNEAVRFYRRYLQRAPNARNREDVERKIAEQEKIVEDRRKAQMATQPAAPVPATTTPPAPPPVTTTVTPAPAPVPEAPAPAATAGTEAQAPVAAAAEPPSKARAIVGWSLVGAGVVLGVVSVIEGHVAKTKGDDLTNMSKQVPKVEFQPNIQQDGKNANTAAIVFGIAGGAAAVAGAIVLITTLTSGAESPPPATASATVAPWLGAGIVGAGANIRF
jgi:cell division protein FtsN